MIIIISSVVSNVFTATESAAIACVYAFIITFFVYHEIKIKEFGKILLNTLRAAVYLRNCIADHIFTDGNKRTAVTIAGIFLTRNGWRMTASAVELENFAVRVATNHLDIDAIADWLERHSRDVSMV